MSDTSDASTPDPTSESPDPDVTKSRRKSSEKLLESLRKRMGSSSNKSLEELAEDDPDFIDDLRQLHEELGLPGLTEGVPMLSAQPGLLIGDYKLVRELGRGGMGEVWEVEQVSIRRRVAIKLLSSFRVSDQDLLRFQREAEACARLNHSAIVTIHGKEEWNGTHFIIQELVEGGRNLHDVLNEHRVQADLPPNYYRWVAEAFLKITEGLDAAHKAGVIHRDIKPANILLSADNEPKITDFGLAKFMDSESISMTGDMSGTYPYMSPEQAMAKRIGIDHRTDIFSLSTTLYEALTLNRAFDGDTSQQIIEKILIEDPPVPHAVRSRVPMDLSVLCMKGLEKNRANRYQNMTEMMAELRRFLDGEPILARPPGPGRLMVKWARRHPAVTASFSVALLAMFAVSILFAITLNAKADLEVTSADLQLRNQELAAANLQKEEERNRADEERRKVLRLSDLKALRDLKQSAEELWPGYPHQTAELDRWLGQADFLLAHREQHEAFLAELQDLSTYDTPRTALTPKQRAWWTEALATLVADLRAFSQPRTGILSSVRQRRDKSVTIGKLCFEDHELDWEDAIFEISESSHYGGLELVPQIGLVPLGPDPDSGLWEFWHVETGERPLRDPSTGRFRIEGETGLVMVLIPGGVATLGSQSEDRYADYFDPRHISDEILHTVELGPFFLAKHEFTLAQWQRAGTTDPSYLNAQYTEAENPAIHPVESVSWFDCVEVLRHVGLVLPTEAQWEFAARGGTDTPWWTGTERDSLTGAANLADIQYSRRFKDVRRWEAWLDDGYPFHSPVDAYRANPFGLHNIAGNVWEWCQDLYGAYELPVADGDGLRLVPHDEDRVRRVYRGGSFYNTALDSRPANRSHYSPEDTSYNVGMRPARRIDPR